MALRFEMYVNSKIQFIRRSQVERYNYPVRWQPKLCTIIFAKLLNRIYCQCSERLHKKGWVRDIGSI